MTLSKCLDALEWVQKGMRRARAGLLSSKVLNGPPSDEEMEEKQINPLIPLTSSAM